ncbi:branched-chain amino acid transport system ATP-binding protein [Pseudorhizobium tarimense]|uniref:Branched-chain amino acid transport system ATP-binding protein n=1 Tax=Pseudorhizobium tarimense TaxID=1079109 RepID=A0ABV2H4E8_9HYPH|nr:ABC transporter ATP-binding protein [Pseudorhizobium tarimense]MCJ8518643.1 ABC transporter ATP-binding protein [Pseudorhizobium tarimense]
MTVVLETRRLQRNFGAFMATNDVSLQIEQGARHALIGPNGAGKTTFINLLAGVRPVSSGQIFLEGKDITTLPSHVRVKKGLTRTFQINQLFADYTPLETVTLAMLEREGVGGSLWSKVTGHGALVDEAAALLSRFRLAAVMDERTDRLPYGKQRLLEIALAFAAKPRVLLLDEPAAGVPEDERHEVLQIVSDLPSGVTVVLIEHDMDLVFSFASRISVLVAGAIFAEGTVQEIAANPGVRAVYLGEAA